MYFVKKVGIFGWLVVGYLFALILWYNSAFYKNPN